LTGDYILSLQCFAGLAALSIIAAFAARQPRSLNPSPPG
jgi:hypothetical protein